MKIAFYILLFILGIVLIKLNRRQAGWIAIAALAIYCIFVLIFIIIAFYDAITGNPW